MRCLSRHVCLLLTLMSVGCAPGGADLPVPTPSAERFVREVYPVLLRDCGFPQCHGSVDRAFQVFGPGRTRLLQVPNAEPAEDIFAPVTSLELQVSYERARSMLTRTDGQHDYFLLRKPLDVGAGGTTHAARQGLTQNVYATREEPAWQLLQAWALESGTGLP
jgi:hypothetical protein